MVAAGIEPAANHRGGVSKGSSIPTSLRPPTTRGSGDRFRS